ncbi:zinc finger protein, partial [Clarias magur]
PGKSGFNGEQQTLQAQVKLCFVRLVDCGKTQNRKAAAESDAEDEDDSSDFIPS